MNRLKGYLPIELDRTRYLRFDMNAFAEFQAKTGIAPHKLLDPKTDLGAVETRTLLWAGLLHEDPDYVKGLAPSITERQIGALIGGDNYSYVQGRLIEAVFLGFGVDLEKVRKAASETKGKAEGPAADESSNSTSSESSPSAPSN